MTVTNPTAEQDEIHDRRVARATEILNELLVVRKLAARDALAEIVGPSRTDDNDDGLYHDALTVAVWRKVQGEII